jgi:hypothetical protein
MRREEKEEAKEEPGFFERGKKRAAAAAQRRISLSLSLVVSVFYNTKEAEAARSTGVDPQAGE